MSDVAEAEGAPRRVLTVEPDGHPRQHHSGVQRLTFVPLKIRRRQMRKVLTPPPGSPAADVRPALDLSMIKMLGKAFYWQRLLDAGKVASVKELAREQQVHPGWISEVLRLTLLAPDIVAAVLEGKQPRHLNFHVIRGRDDLLPWEWHKQREVLGFIAPQDAPVEAPQLQPEAAAFPAD